MSVTISNRSSSTSPPVKRQGTKSRGWAIRDIKVRIRNTDAKRGKSSGYRIIYYLKANTDVLFVTIYSKTDQSDVEVEDVLRIIREEEHG